MIRKSRRVALCFHNALSKLPPLMAKIVKKWQALRKRKEMLKGTCDS